MDPSAIVAPERMRAGAGAARATHADGAPDADRSGAVAKETIERGATSYSLPPSAGGSPPPPPILRACPSRTRTP